MQREMIVTKLVCAKCGENLQLRYYEPTHPGRCADGEPTGAAMVHHIVAVEPCETCMRPVVAVRTALRALQAMTEGGDV